MDTGTERVAESASPSGANNVAEDQDQEIWVISDKQSAKYLKHFNLLKETSPYDPPLLSHVLTFFGASSLSHDMLMKVWTLVQVDEGHESQHVSLAQFSVAFHIVTAVAVLGVAIPIVLSDELSSLLSADSEISADSVAAASEFASFDLFETSTARTSQQSDAVHTPSVTGNLNGFMIDSSTPRQEQSAAEEIAGGGMVFGSPEMAVSQSTSVAAALNPPVISHGEQQGFENINGAFQDPLDFGCSDRSGFESNLFQQEEESSVSSLSSSAFPEAAVFSTTNQNDFGNFDAFEAPSSNMPSSSKVAEALSGSFPGGFENPFGTMNNNNTIELKNTKEPSFEEALSMAVVQESPTVTADIGSNQSNGVTTIDHDFVWQPAEGVEVAWFANLFTQADVDGDGIIGGQEGVQFLMRSGRTREELRAVWDIASRGAPTLTRSAFYEAMRLVQLAQHGYDIGVTSVQDMKDVRLPALPQINAINAVAEQMKAPAALSPAGAEWWQPSTAAEVELFAHLFAQADVDGDGIVGGREGVSFLMRSGLPKIQLREVWDKAAAGSPNLTRASFFHALRLVQLAQNDLPPNASEAERAHATMQLPTFECGCLEDQFGALEALFQTVPTTNLDGTISGLAAVTFLRRSALDDTTLRQIWEMCAGGKATLDRQGFFHAMRLVAKLQNIEEKGGLREGWSLVPSEYLPLPRFE